MQEDLTGKKFGRLTVSELSDKKYSDGTRLWKCRCDCGNEGYYLGRYLKKGTTKSCGCLQRELSSKRHLDDLTGQKFGKLTVIERADDYIRRNGSGKEPRWKCRCDCGNITIVNASGLKSGTTKSCGCVRSQKNDLTGQRFGYLTVIAFSHRDKKRFFWKCACDCGKEIIVDRSSLISGATTSCGHVRLEHAVENRKNIAENYYADSTSIFAAIDSNKLRSSNKSGVNGVYQYKGKWRATITFKGVNYYLGQYTEIEDAASARKEAEEKLHGPFCEWYAEHYPDQWENLKNKNK